MKGVSHMGNSHIDEMLLQNFALIELSEGTKAEMWSNVVAGLPKESIDKHIRRQQRKAVFGRRIFATTASIAAVAISALLVYKMAIILPLSQKPTITPLKSTKVHPPVNALEEYYKIHPPVTAGEKYYKKSLGFQPMLPSYIPNGLKTADSAITVSKDVHGKNGSFSVILCNKNLSGQKTFLSGHSINISEEPLTQYVQQHSQVVQKHSTIHQNGLTISVYRRQSNTLLELEKRGVSYSVGAMTKDYTTSELIKVLESLNVPEQQKPIISMTTVVGSLSGALKEIRFKASIPTFVPEGFIEHESSSFGTTDLRKGSFNSLMSEFQILYVNGGTSILVDEIYESGGIFLPRSKMTTIKGRKVHVREHGLGYSWKDPKSGVVYNVNVSSSTPHSAIDRPTLEKLVASMIS